MKMAYLVRHFCSCILPLLRHSSKGKNLFLSTDEFWKFVTHQRFLGQLQNEQVHPPMKKHEVVDLIHKLEPTRPRTGGDGV